MWTRTVYGTRVSLIVGVAVAILSISIGLVVGMLAGYIRLLDSIVMRVMDGLMAIPGVLLAIAMVSLSGASMFTVIVAITVPEIPRVVRLVRAVVLTVREEPYVEAAIAAGTRLPLILIRHVLPNCVPALIVQATYVCASAMLTEAILSFPRRRHAARDPELGEHDGRGPRILSDRSADHSVSRRGARAGDPRRQRAWRRSARPARSETRAAGVTHARKMPRPVAVPCVICRTSRHSKAAWLPLRTPVASGQRHPASGEIPVMWKAWKVAATAAVLALPCGANAQTTLKVVMHSDLKIVDPIWTTAYITRNHGYMVYDTLFAMDEKGEIKPQMVDKYDVSADKLTYTFTLRDGLAWHDGAPVTAEDCVASIKRWAAKDSLGQKVMSFVDTITVGDAKTFTVKLKEQTGLLIFALGKPSSNVPFMMPKRVAETDPNTQISDFTGSGPFVFKRDEWKPGDKAVYVKFDKYKPRSEPASGLAGGKVVEGRPRRVACDLRSAAGDQRAARGRDRLHRVALARPAAAR